MEFDRLGLYNLAFKQFSALLNENKDNALNIFRLIKVFLEEAITAPHWKPAKSSPALPATRIRLLPAYPPYFTYLEYGTYYHLPWIKAAAEKYNLSELLLLSVIYQESHFGAQAASGAGARGSCSSCLPRQNKSPQRRIFDQF